MSASLKDKLRAKRAEHLKPKSLTLRLPGWEGPYLFVRYAPVDWEALSALLEKSAEASTPRTALRSNLQALAQACDAILVQDETPQPESLADVLRHQGEQVAGEVKFDHVLTDVLALDLEDKDQGVRRAPESASETVLAAFTGAVSPELAVAEHAARLGAWMAGASAEVDESILGGSSTSL